MRSIAILVAALVGSAFSQTDTAQQNPPVKVNVLNVCTPTGEQQQEIKTALSHLPQSPLLDQDFEIARGLSTVENRGAARYVRLRRDLKPEASIATVQYSLSADPQNMAETLVFRGRNVKELLQLSIEDKLSTSVSDPTAVVESDTPASRISIERFGKTTVTLARCQGTDQSAYEPLFKEASEKFAEYRRALNLRTFLATDLRWLRVQSATHRSSQPAVPPISPH